ncbi:MAG: 30S ribosomal protein S17e [Candidatus Diapherotrites archaeon]
MGKAVPRIIKVRAEELVNEMPGSFSVDFDKNKEVLATMDLPFSKVQRNLVAGFISRIIQQKNEASN